MDLFSIIDGNANITIPIIEHINHLYSYFNESLHKSLKSLKEYISRQNIKNNILNSDYQVNHNSDYQVNHDNWTFSGYYLFDSLWVKKNYN